MERVVYGKSEDPEAPVPVIKAVVKAVGDEEAPKVHSVDRL